MNIKTEDGIVKGVRYFWEYEYVKRHTEDLGRLIRIHDIRLDRPECTRLLDGLCLDFGLRHPRFKWTGRTDRGTYFYGENLLRLRPSYISAELAIHELTHHWTYTKFDGTGHGHDFVVRLDRLAERAWERLT